MRKGMRSVYFLLLFLFSLLHGFQENEKFDFDLHTRVYTEIRPKDDPRAARAHEIFTQVLKIAGKPVGLLPRLFVAQESKLQPPPPAEAFPGGGIIISSKTLDLCYKQSDRGDDRLAFILAHEIAHEILHHVAMSFSRADNPKDNKSLGENKQEYLKQQRDKEIEADKWGIVYASIAGFDTRAVVTEDDQINLFRYVEASENINVETNDADHPSADVRAKEVKARLMQVLDTVDLFDLGLLFYQTGDYAQAAALFFTFLQSYPSPEVYHNLAACHHRLAQKYYREWKGEDKDFPFKLSVPVESESRAHKITLRGGPTPDSEAGFKEEIGKAIEYYQTALSQDASYWPSANNLGCALLLDEDTYGAVASLHRALRITPDSPLVLNNLGVAFYLMKDLPEARKNLQAALKIDPAYNAPLYNLGGIAFLENDRAEAKKQWDAYLKNDPDSIWAERVLTSLEPGQAPKASEAKPAWEPENISGLTVGAYSDAIPADWGAPARKNSLLGEENPVLLTVYVNGIMVVVQKDEVIRLSASRPFSGQTVKGLSLGAAKKDLIAKYGKPPSVLPSTAGEAWVYARQGITFIVRDGKVTSWILFKS